MIYSHIKHKTFNFPCGEMQVNLCESPRNACGELINVGFEFKKNDDIIELLQYCEILKRNGYTLNNLRMDYVPFSRQDRPNETGECFSLKVFCDLINSLEFKFVHITDPHSDVTPALIKNVLVTPQEDIFKESVDSWTLFISPDAGSTKKIHKLARKYKDVKVLQCMKERNTQTGAITKTTTLDCFPLDNYTCWIIDDICDGGRTFTEIANILRGWNAKSIKLFITHGFFTKGMEVFSLIDEIYTKDGRVK